MGKATALVLGLSALAILATVLALVTGLIGLGTLKVWKRIRRG